MSDEDIDIDSFVKELSDTSKEEEKGEEEEEEELKLTNTTFSLSCNYIDNLRTIIEKFPSYKEHTFTISINNKVKITIPTVFAATLSKTITKILENDPTAKTFPCTLNDASNEALNKIKDVITNNVSVTLKDEQEIKTFASFGLSIGNNEFVSPLKEKLNADSFYINISNVTQILSTKEAFHIEEIEKETNYICKYFYYLMHEEKFVEYCCQNEHIEFVEKILSNEEIKIRDEDDLLSFILKIIQSKEANEINKTLTLFKYVFLEYCSPEKCKEFISFVGKIIPEFIKDVFACISRRLLQPKLPMKPNYIESRHAY